MMRIGKVSAAVLAVFGLAAACDASSSDSESSQSGEESDASVTGPASCSETRQEGASCTLPQGTSCLQGACGESVFVCSRGVWMEHSVVLSGTCPALAPAAGDPCSACFPSEMTCDFNTECEDGGAPIRARCVSSVWSTELLSCADAGAPDPIDAESDAEIGDSAALAQ